MRRSRAVVAGAGIGGLAAAAALLPHFDEVIVFEKDDTPGPLDVRSGANQGAHAHTLLRGGLLGFEKLLPGLHDAFERAGAVELDVGSDFEIFDFGDWRVTWPLGLLQQLMSRPAYEKVVREQTEALGNVTVRSGVRIDKIAFESGVAKAVVVNGELFVADLIVDARGRGGSLPKDLQESGFGRTPETVIGIAMWYVSGRFKRPPDYAESKRAILVRPEPPDRRYGMVYPVEGGDWIVSLAGRGAMEEPVDIDSFFEFARRLATPALYEMINGAELISALARYRKPTANWRHYDRLTKFPRRLIPLGDTISSFNPTFGQGMTVAVNHALALAAALSSSEAGDDELFKAYIGPAMAATETAWRLAGNADFEFPEVTGERPDDLEMVLAFVKGLKLLSVDDPAIHRMGLEVFHMERSEACFQDETIAARVMAKLMEASAK